MVMSSDTLDSIKQEPSKCMLACSVPNTYVCMYVRINIVLFLNLVNAQKRLRLSSSSGSGIGIAFIQHTHMSTANNKANNSA